MPPNAVKVDLGIPEANSRFQIQMKTSRPAGFFMSGVNVSSSCPKTALK